MSTTIDQKVVQMKFDNSNFEKNVQNSLASIIKLKNALRFDAGMMAINRATGEAGKINLTPVNNELEKVQARFRALDVIGVTTLVNITNAALRAGKRIVSALTIDPIRTGLQEYETQINSVQTILANTESKGTTLNQVNAALDELNRYADLTIYNFTEMTRNIGTFTAAGVELDTSVQAIKGIANLAAVSGSNAQQASSAMYQLSQALAAGTVKLMDWNSVVNAGMGGQVFQDALKETARVHGIAIDDMIKKEGSFRETLQHGWLSSEILTETLAKFTGDLTEGQLKAMGYSEKQIQGIIKLGKTANDAATKVKTLSQLWSTLQEAAQSGWAQTWKIIIGDFGEAKEFYTEISEVISGFINSMSEARNTLLSEGLSSGWKQLLNAGIADEAGYTDMIKEVSKSQGIAIDSLIEKQGSFEAVLKSGAVSSDILKEALSKLTDKTKNLSDEELVNLGYTRDQITALEELNEKVQNGTVSLDAFLEKMTNNSGRENLIEAMWNSFNGLLAILKPIKQAFRDIFPRVTGDQLYGVTEKIKELTENFKVSKEVARDIRNTFSGLFSVLALGKDIVVALTTSVLKIVGKLMGTSGTILGITGSIGKFVTNVVAAIRNTNSFNKALNGITDSISMVIFKFGELISFVWSNVKNIGDVLGGMFDGVITAFNNLSGGLSVNTFNLFNAGFLTATALGIKKFIKILEDSMRNFTGVKDGVVDILKKIGNVFENYQSKLDALLLSKISASIALVAGAVFLLSTIDTPKLLTALGGLSAVLVSLQFGLKIYSTFAKSMKNIANTIAALTAIANSILILSGALKILSTINFKGMVSGLVGLMGVMTTLVMFLKATSGLKMKKTKGLIGLATGVVILSSALKILSTMNLKEVATAVTAMASSLFIIIQAVNSINGTGLLKSSTAIFALSSSMVVLATAMRIFGSLSWSSLATGITALASSLTVLSVGLAAISRIDGGGKAALTLTVLSSALAIFAPAIATLSLLSWGGIAKGLITIAGAFTILGTAGVVLGPLTPTLLGLAGALGMTSGAIMGLGLGITAIGAGITSLSIGLTALASSAITGAVGITTAISSILIGIINTIPLAATTLATGVINFATTLANGATALATAATKLVSAALDAFKTLIPKFVTTLFKLLTTLLQQLAINIPKFTKAGVDIIVGLLSGIAKSMIKVVKTGADIVIGIIRGLRKQIPRLVSEGFKLIITVLNTMANAVENYTPKLMKAFFNLGASAIKGIIKGLFSGIGALLSAVADLGRKMANKFAKFLEINSPSKLFARITESVPEGAALGIKRKTPVAVKSVIGMASSMKDSLNDTFKINQNESKVAQVVGESIPKGLASGIKEASKEPTDAMINALDLTALALTDFTDTILNDEQKKLLDELYFLEGYYTETNKLYKSSVKNNRTYWEELYLSTEQGVADAEYLLNTIDSIDKEAVERKKEYKKQLKELTGKSAKERKELKKKFHEDMKALDEQRAAARQDFLDKQLAYEESILQEANNIVDGYLNQLNSAADAITNASSIFEQLNIKESASRDEMIANMEGRAEVIDRYIDIMSQLEVKYGNGDFYNDVISKKGLEDLNLLNELLYSTETEANHILSVYDSIKKASEEAAKLQIRKEEFIAEEQLQDLFGGVKVKFDEFVAQFDGSFASLDKYVNNSLQMGAEIALNIAIGIKQESDKLNAQADETAKDAVGAVSTVVNNESPVIGKNMVLGFANGVELNSYIASAAARYMAAQAAQAAKDELQIHSPSRVFGGFGKNVVLSFANRLAEGGKMVYSISKNLAQESITGLAKGIANLSDMVDEQISTDPVIRPILDLSNVESGIQRINALFSTDRANSVSLGFKKFQNGFESSEGRNTVFKFTQNNYSPKALSRIDIYRQTRNQFAEMKGLVEV